MTLVRAAVGRSIRRAAGKSKHICNFMIAAPILYKTLGESRILALTVQTMISRSPFQISLPLNCSRAYLHLFWKYIFVPCVLEVVETFFRSKDIAQFSEFVP